MCIQFNVGSALFTPTSHIFGCCFVFVDGIIHSPLMEYWSMVDNAPGPLWDYDLNEAFRSFACIRIAYQRVYSLSFKVVQLKMFWGGSYCSFLPCMLLLHNDGPCPSQVYGIITWTPLLILHLAAA